MVKFPDGSGWNNSASFQGCTFSWTANKTAVNLFGAPRPLGHRAPADPTPGVDPIANSSQCAVFTAQPEQFRPVIFWFFTYQPSAMASLTLCTPAIALLDAGVQLDLASGNLTAVAPLGALGAGAGTPRALAQFAGNVSGAPLAGRAYNGLFFALDSPDPFTLQRQTAIQLALPAAVFQAAQASGLTEAFQQNKFAELSEHIYVRIP